MGTERCVEQSNVLGLSKNCILPFSRQKQSISSRITSPEYGNYTSEKKLRYNSGNCCNLKDIGNSDISNSSSTITTNAGEVSIVAREAAQLPNHAGAPPTSDQTDNYQILPCSCQHLHNYSSSNCSNHCLIL